MYSLKNKKIVSPMAWGSGAYVIHRILEENLANYHVAGYDPLRTLLPFTIPAVVPAGNTALIHTTPDYAMFTHKKSIPTIVTFHNYVLDAWMRQHSSVVQRLHHATDLKFATQYIVQRAAAITAVSRFTAELVRKELHPDQPVQVIYNGIDSERFRPPAAPDSKPGGISVLFCGNLTRRKGAHWLPAIAKRLQSGITIYYTQGLRTRKSLLPNVRLRSLGPVSYRSMPQVYREMDILLMPTVREGFGLAVAEAMACGLPIVASDCSAIPELVDEAKGGFLCPVGNVVAFADKINILADSPARRCEMGQYNRSKIEIMFTLQRMVDGYRRLFDTTLDRYYNNETR